MTYDREAILKHENFMWWSGIASLGCLSWLVCAAVIATQPEILLLGFGIPFINKFIYNHYHK